MASITVDFPPLLGPTRTVIPLPLLPSGMANSKRLSEKGLSAIQADDFYEVVTGRYMKKTTIFTSSRSIEDWQSLFPDPVIANSVLDRIAHNAHQLTMTGESYRCQRAKKGNPESEK